ncbi:MAG: hypothetical protein ACKO6F_01870, partial [Cyanobium sp.]
MEGLQFGLGRPFRCLHLAGIEPGRIHQAPVGLLLAQIDGGRVAGAPADAHHHVGELDRQLPVFGAGQLAGQADEQLQRGGSRRDHFHRLGRRALAIDRREVAGHQVGQQPLLLIAELAIAPGDRADDAQQIQL